MSATQDTYPQTVDLAETAGPWHGFKGSTEIPMPSAGWGVGEAEVHSASPFYAAVGVVYETPEGPDQKDLLLRRPSGVVAAFRTNPESGQRELLVVSQLRHGSGQEEIELPGGMAKGGENLASAAVRELEEETGLSWQGNLGRPFVMQRDPARSPGLFAECYDVELSGDLPARSPIVEPGEHITGRAWTPVQTLFEMNERGEVTDVVLAAALGREAQRQLHEAELRIGQLVAQSAGIEHPARAA